MPGAEDINNWLMDKTRRFRRADNIISRGDQMDLMQKLSVLGESARYDVSCSSSGSQRAGGKGIGNTVASGICHTWTADGRCVSLLKVLLTNECIYDCVYCMNRRSNDIVRSRFTAAELAELTIAFYRRNYIEGLFLSSGVWRGPDETMEQMIKTLQLLRHEHQFNGYIHAKAIPGCSENLVEQLGLLADRVSINIEQCSKASLAMLAPQKSFERIFQPMQYLTSRLTENKRDLVRYRHTPAFSPAGQSTQIIIGASPEPDALILKATEKLYREYQMKRVYYSAYMPVNQDQRLPAITTMPPLVREHRLYQADWLMRFYHFNSGEILDGAQQLDLDMDPKAAWALRHLDLFPVEVNRADWEMLLRVPGIGVRSAQKIMAARKHHRITADDLKRMRVSLKRAGWFLTCNGKYAATYTPSPEVLRLLLADTAGRQRQAPLQLSMEQVYADLV